MSTELTTRTATIEIVPTGATGNQLSRLALFASWRENRQFGHLLFLSRSREERQGREKVKNTNKGRFHR